MVAPIIRKDVIRMFMHHSSLLDELKKLAGACIDPGQIKVDGFKKVSYGFEVRNCTWQNTVSINFERGAITVSLRILGTRKLQSRTIPLEFVPGDGLLTEKTWEAIKAAPWPQPDAWLVPLQERLAQLSGGRLTREEFVGRSRQWRFGTEAGEHTFVTVNPTEIYVRYVGAETWGCTVTPKRLPDHSDVTPETYDELAKLSWPARASAGAEQS